MSITDLHRRVLMAARDFNVNSILFRNATGRKMRLNITDSECLSLLTIKGTATPTELARHTGLTTGATTAMLDRLEKIGFISRTPNPEDRRGVIVEVSPWYRKTVGPLMAGIQQGNKAVLARYSEKELEVIADFLERFAANVAESTEKVGRTQ